RTRRPGPGSPDWLEGFDDAVEAARDAFATRMALHPDDPEGQRIQDLGFRVGPALGPEALDQELRLLLRQLGWPSSAKELRAFALLRSSPVAKARKYSTDDADFLNSFFIRDLGRSARTMAEGRAGKALASYLAAPSRIEAQPRVDVRRDTAAVARALLPARFPAGRWPSKYHHPLVLSQQLAVNLAFSELADGAGILGVNGPPGTGKTTLLRDLVAAVVVRRADVLARLRAPEEAFGEVAGRWRSGSYFRTLRALHPDLAGHEIVVASSNNGAVENVTLEIPAQDAIDPSWLEEGRYFADVASAVIGRPAWGLLAAVLGNKQNRSRFVTDFWFGGGAAAGSRDETTPTAGTRLSAASEPPSPKGFLGLLQAAAAAERPSWPAAVRRYRTASAAVRRLAGERQAVADALAELPRLAAALANAALAQRAAAERLQEARRIAADRQAALQTAADHLDAMAGQLAAVQRARPGLLAILLSWGREFREWSAEARERRRRVDDAYRNVEASRQASAQAEAARALAEQALATAAAQHRDLQSRRQAATQAIAAFRHTSPALVPDDEFWDRGRAETETCSPWVDDAWNRARAQVFLEALRLHQALVLGAPELVRRNLLGAMDILQGRLSETAGRSAIRAAWSTLFLVVPVVSTTFASFDRLFSHLHEEELGWLLIDEAGQAVPQAAAGAIARARRVVVVGDPRQLEPVVTIPDAAIGALRRHFAVADVWQPNVITAQFLADRASRFGTHLEGHDGEREWVGTPLRVHRRCDEPMFSVANGIAYNGLMVHGTPPAEHLAAWPASCWLDVRATTSEGNWIPAEGEEVLRLLRSLPTADPAAQLAILSPFRHVVRGLKDTVGKAFPRLHIGTVHTYQGKEQAAIVLVLGGNVNAEGPLDWAARRPNLLNVALTRAKRRVYVVGNRERWRSRTYFGRLASSLPLAPDAGGCSSPGSNRVAGFDRNGWPASPESATNHREGEIIG
ncbi:MAG TPA: ATP-binding protein, partial [Thermoanaerobaculia bacterium]|nr:ATP-binding protein [Thermoanaerobaculia bacterium]